MFEVYLKISFIKYPSLSHMVQPRKDANLGSPKSRFLKDWGGGTPQIANSEGLELCPCALIPDRQEGFSFPFPCPHTCNSPSFMSQEQTLKGRDSRIAHKEREPDRNGSGYNPVLVSQMLLASVTLKHIGCSCLQTIKPHSRLR